jgi:hypothetical protein
MEIYEIVIIRENRMMGPKSFLNFVFNFINTVKHFKEILSWDECTPHALAQLLLTILLLCEKLGCFENKTLLKNFHCHL